MAITVPLVIMSAFATLFTVMCRKKQQGGDQAPAWADLEGILHTYAELTLWADMTLNYIIAVIVDVFKKDLHVIHEI